MTIRILPSQPSRSAGCELLEATHQFATDMIKASEPRPSETGDVLAVAGLLALEAFFYTSAKQELRCRR